MTSRAASTGSAPPTFAFDPVRLGRLTFRTGTRGDAIAALRGWFATSERNGIIVGFVNPHVYNSAIEHQDVAEFLRECSFVCVDGVGVTAAARLVNGSALPRTVATALFEDLLGDPLGPASTSAPMQALLIGTTEDEVVAAAAAMNAQLPAVHIVEAMDGFRDLDDYDALMRKYPDIDAVLVGAGAPRSEQILLRVPNACQRALAFHIGAGTIKIYAGTKRRAPSLMSRFGLEWLHRITFEPHTRVRYGRGAWTFGRDVWATRNGETAL